MKSKTQQHPYCNLLFGSDGGEMGVKEILAKAIRKARTAKNISNEDLDRACRFGQKLPGNGHLLPKSRDFEANPNLLTSFIFSLASSELGIALNRVLKPKWSNQVLQYVTSDMKAKGAGLVAGCGGGDVRKVAKNKQVRVYALLRVMDELGRQS